jgi:hypothetical protein
MAIATDRETRASSACSNVQEVAGACSTFFTATDFMG